MSREGSTPPTRMGVTLAILLAGLFAGCGQGDSGQNAGADQRPVTSASTVVVETSGVGTGQSPKVVTLYFLSESGRLSPEKRAIPPEGTLDAQARRVIEELMKGPVGPLARVLPIGTGLRSIYLRPDGAAYVDFDMGFSRGLAGGSEDGLTAIWSVTDTLAANFPEVTHVKILVEGEEVRDLGGHLDLSRPLVPDMTLVEEPPGGQGPEV